MTYDVTTVLSIGLGVAEGAIFLYAGFWAFAIRRALVTRAYRDQARWLGGVCLYLIPSNLFPVTNEFFLSFVITLYYLLLPIILFAWIDASIPILRRSDPKLRSILGWKRLRIIVWGATLLSVIVAFVSIAGNGFAETTLSTPVLVLFLLPYLAVLATGAPALMVGALRSWDRTLRRSLKWFGLFVAVLLMEYAAAFALVATGFVVASLTALYSPLTVLITSPLLFAAYCLYRSSRSLAPLNSISMEGVANGATTLEIAIEGENSERGLPSLERW